MNLKKTALSTALLTVVGASAMLPSTASAVLSDGTWALTIATTPVRPDIGYGTSFKIGKDGAYNSSFSFGHAPDNTSNGMTDTDAKVNGQGTGIGGDGLSGDIELSVVGGAFTVPGTDMVGTVDSAGNFSLTPTGRLGTINAPDIIGAPWNIDNKSVPGATNWNGLSTGDATGITDPGTGDTTTINGALLTNAGDLDGDSIDDFTGVLVGGGQVGDAWGSFFGATYFETWSVEILSGGGASGFNVDTIFGTAGGDFAQHITVESTVIPVPAAVWLFGSGLMGLVGVARRKKA